jgi:iron complex transport system permease protein
VASHIVVRPARAPISFRIGVASVATLAIAVAGIVGFFAVGVGSGDYPISPVDVLVALVGGGDETSRFVVWELRLPRLLSAVLVGAALAVSGAIFQSLARNPLVAPDIIGINGGAALAAVTVIILRGPDAIIAPAALAGGLAAAAAVYILSWQGGLGRYRLVLVGIGVAALAEAGIGYLLTRGQIFDVVEATIWLVGSLSSASWGDVLLMSLVVGALFPATFLLARSLTTLQLGDDAAAGLGVSLERTRLILVGIGVALAAFAVTVGGPIAFVAFIAPHLARRLARVSGSGLIPASAAIGALLLLASDIVARRAIDPADLPVGIVTAIVGAPYFLWLLVRTNRLGAGV